MIYYCNYPVLGTEEYLGKNDNKGRNENIILDILFANFTTSVILLVPSARKGFFFSDTPMHVGR